ncbi:thioredoxin family protein [Dethiosulfatarculus sandiegensis]|uniref:Thioredoxin n=1 Tax=Dethiosulfatarculus sandiegensis TaxID=1429043 RepID=A0A0D2GDS6_9BACT|nr:thioredoxin family protein [Dethiosulfatarculus sandiegensis]KIX13107.1 thioredoxin [Dethiosulfatarculus sandiegensis]
MKRISLVFSIALVLLSAIVSSAEMPHDANQLPVKGMVTMIDLGADKCIPCKMMAPIIKEVREEYNGKAVIAFIDVWKDRSQVDRFKLKGIPTQIFFDKNGKEQFRHLGFMDKEKMVSYLEKMGVTLN